MPDNPDDNKFFQPSYPPQRQPLPPSSLLPPIQNPPSVPVSTKGSKKGLLIAALGGLFVLVIIIVLAVVLGTKSSNDTPATVVVAPNNQIYFQSDRKILTYNPKTTKTEIVTAALPLGARVLDFFADNDTWRTYYQTTPTTASGPSEIFFLEKDKEAALIASLPGILPVAAANANKRVVGYTLPYQPKAETDITKATRTLVRRGTQPQTEVLRSANFGGDTKTTEADVKNPGYTVADISPDGESLLFNLYTCFNCGGAIKASAIEVKINTKASQLVYTSSENGHVAYAADGKGYEVTETKNSLVGQPTGPLYVTISKLVAPGASAEILLRINEPTWGLVVYDPGLKYLAVEERAPDYATTVATLFKGLFSNNGNQGNNLQLLKVSGLPSETSIITQSGEVKNNCYGVIMTSRNLKNPQQTTRLGSICKKDTGNEATFNSVDALTYDAVASPPTAQVLSN